MSFIAAIEAELATVRGRIVALRTEEADLEAALRVFARLANNQSALATSQGDARQAGEGGVAVRPSSLAANSPEGATETDGRQLSVSTQPTAGIEPEDSASGVGQASATSDEGQATGKPAGERSSAAPRPFANGFIPPTNEMVERTAKRVEVAELNNREPWLTPEEAATRLLIPVVNLRIFTTELDIEWSRPRPSLPASSPPAAAKPITLREKVRGMWRMHPNWTARMISNELGAPHASVSTYLAEVRRDHADGLVEQPPAPINREVA